MMKKKFVKDLREGEDVDDFFLVVGKELREFKTKPGIFLQLKLMDGTGSITARCWEGAEEVSALVSVGDVVQIKGTVESFQDELQIIFEPYDISKCDELSPQDLLPKTEKDVDGLLSEIRATTLSFEDEHLRRLVLSFLDDEAFVAKFKTAPAAKTYHHPYIGGLIEHTHAVMKICDLLAELYGELDRDLLLTGAILHDIGKIRGYEFENIIDVSVEGGLVGHVLLSLEMLNEKLKELSSLGLGLPEELCLKLRHLITSHHCHRKWGSPIEPRFAEASALCYADLLDARVNEFLRAQSEALQQREQREGEGVWSDFSKSLRTFLYLGASSKDEDGEGEE
ncbi:3'-5' exoribonuclease YhaM family protein [Candidatus Alkanophaga liquidiphilum]